MKELDDIDVEEWAEEFEINLPILIEDDWSMIMMEVEEEPYEEWLVRELSEMGMEVEMQHGDKDIEMGVQDILEHQRICLERQSRNEAQLLLQYQDPGVPEPEGVMESHLGEGVEEDCTAGYQGGTWWLGRWMMKDNTENKAASVLLT